MAIKILTEEDLNGVVKTVNGVAPDENGNVDTDPGFSGTGYVKSVNGAKPDGVGNVEIPVGGGLSTTAANLLITILRDGVYSTNQSANITALAAELGVTEEVPDVPDEPEKTLTSISATYSGGSIPVGTAVSALTGIVVTAHYSDGTTEAVTGYTLSGTIAEGSNTVTVSYGGKTATFAVTGVAESGGEATDNPFDSATWTTGTFYYDFNAKNGTELTMEKSDYSSTDLVDIRGYSNIATEDLTAGIKTCVILYYDAEMKAFAKGGGYYKTGDVTYPSPRFDPIPENAVYCRISQQTKQKNGTKFYVT